VFLPVRPPDVWKRHLVDYWGRQVGLETIPPPRWSAPAAWRRLAQKALADAGLEGERPCLLIHPGAGAREKCWPLERFAELARARTVPSPSPGRSRIPEESIPVFVLGPVELEWWGRRTVDALRGEFVTVLAPPLPVLAGLCAAAAAFVGNDSGPTHLAAALGRPTVALFGPSDPLHFAPRGRRVLVARAKRLSTLGADSVIDALEKV
jgi:ADP-heptose:LPS heptosyltransferase